MMFGLIGLIVGMALALTGAGGAIIGVPLLIYMAHLSVHQASIVALPVVAVSAAMAAIVQRKNIHLSSVAWIVGLAIPTSWLVSVIKPYIPSSIITATIVILAAWALVQVWLYSSKEEKLEHSRSRFLASGIGLLSGAITALTGLGGGLFLFPLLQRFLVLSEIEAAATSVAVIFCNAVVAYGFQRHQAFSAMVGLGEIAFLVGGVVLANAVTLLLTRVCPVTCKQQVVKWVYTGILVGSIGMLVVH